MTAKSATRSVNNAVDLAAAKVKAANAKAAKAMDKAYAKAKVKATIPVGEANEVNDPVAAAMRDYSEARATLFGAVEMPSGKRLLVSTVIGLVTYASTIWVAIPVVELIVAGAIALTGSAFLGFLALVIGAFFAALAAAYGGFKAFSWSMSFDFGAAAQTGRDLRDAAKKRVTLVRDWFKPSAEAAA